MFVPGLIAFAISFVCDMLGISFFPNIDSIVGFFVSLVLMGLIMFVDLAVIGFVVKIFARIFGFEFGYDKDLCFRKLKV